MPLSLQVSLSCGALFNLFVIDQLPEIKTSRGPPVALAQLLLIALRTFARKVLLRDDESCEVAEQAVSFTSRDTNDATLITRIRYQLEHALARLTLETGDALDASERCKRTVLRELGKKLPRRVAEN